MAYLPGIRYERTEAERNDQQLSWDRPDAAFFASGACHILAWQFMNAHVDEGFEIVHIRPKLPHDRGHHVYVTNGEWAFDFNGWTKELELLEMYRAAYSEAIAGWDFDRVIVNVDLDSFCQSNNHRLPSQFVHDPRPRADRFIEAFVASAPSSDV